MTTSADVRETMIEALHLDLIGPRLDDDADHAEEILPAPPSQYYLTGFLVPFGADKEQRKDATADDQVDELDRAGGGDDEDSPEQASKREVFFPCSIGLSVLVPETARELRVEVRWGDYEPEEPDPEPDRPPVLRGGTWRRIPREVETYVGIEQIDAPQTFPVRGSGGLELVVNTRAVPERGGVPPGTRAVSVFLKNDRPPLEDAVDKPEKDRAFVFQPELTLHTLQHFVARPDPRGKNSADEDERIADLQYRDAYEYAVGHNVSAVAVLQKETCRQVRSEWMPVARVEKVKPSEIKGVELGMEALADCESADAVRAKIEPMLDQYAAWIEKQKRTRVAAYREPVKQDLCDRAGKVLDRFAAGLAALRDEHALQAFRLANRAIARAIRQRLAAEKEIEPEQLAPPAWYPFQLAFILTNLAGLVEPKHPDRNIVDLLFFPTGGGKTEAYLGLAAFTLVLRRLRHESPASAGVSVLMRYTLRLLTLDQLARAAAMICALELDRETYKLGDRPFEIGLWVGSSATPNRMGSKKESHAYSARARTIAFKNNDKIKPSPIPLENCPWCGARFNRNSFQLEPNPAEPTELVVYCVNRKCEFHGGKRALPLQAVDESIYRRLPCFVIATVDKFAAMPWVGETAGLFGKVDRYDKDGFYISSIEKKKDRRLPEPLPPPDLVIQDELHLISGPLGTMTGLYETVIDALCERDGVRPKIVASTATVRRARKQIRALFGRDEVEIFPPPGPNRRDSFFAITRPVDVAEPRTYVGVAALGRSLKVVLLRTYLSLCAAAQKQWDEAGGAGNKANPADPYMTLLGYFNALRELGGSRRIVEDEIRSRLADYADRRRRIGESESLLANRTRFREPRELTSRVSTNKLSETKQRLSRNFHHEDSVDVALASNMISVGLDITRLGLMVVLGQPKTAAEYIQTTSRVGRDQTRPGLVVTLLNVHRPRDRSHYERFINWHDSFYRAVEATSVTPFSPRAVDRGLAAVTVALARLGHAGLTPPRGAYAITTLYDQVGFVAEAISRRAECHDKDLNDAESEELRRKVQARVIDLLETWKRLADPFAGTQSLQYQDEVSGPPPLLRNPLDPGLARLTRDARKFKAHWSLRDVEPTVNLWIRTPDGYDEMEDPS